MTDSKHIVFVTKRDRSDDVHVGEIEKITPKFVFLKYGSGSYYETRIAKSKIDYKLFDTLEDRNKFLSTIRAGSTYDEWKYHSNQAETMRCRYRRHLIDFLKHFDEWDDHDELRFCDHPRRITTTSDNPDVQDITKCIDCGKTLT